MGLCLELMQTIIGVGAGFFIAAPIRNGDQPFGLAMIVVSLAIGFALSMQ